jgi:hypothetical protein
MFDMRGLGGWRLLWLNLLRGQWLWSVSQRCVTIIGNSFSCVQEGNRSGVVFDRQTMTVGESPRSLKGERPVPEMTEWRQKSYNNSLDTDAGRVDEVV